MGKALIIAEKPSVAGDIAKVLGKFKKDKDFYENDDYVISSAIGHLVEIGAGDADPKRGKWNIDNLPVVPEHFALNPIERTEARFKLLKKLAARKDVDSLINACDAGREGELIFRYIVQLAKIQKPVKRLWLQSMTPDSIRHGFKHLRSDEEMQPLAAAAQCRSEADWLIGINGTRALTSFNSKGGGFNKTTVGRVQTPTLAILVKREEKIREFQPKPFWEIHALFDAKAGEYPSRWFDENFKKSEGSDDEANDKRLEKAERIWSREKADSIVSACTGQPGIVEEKSKPATQLSPQLFDLTSLQREANSKFGFPARMTLSIAQSLYEKHKALTYPRTDSRYLPEDYLGTVRSTLGKLQGSPLAPFAAKILDNDWVKPNKRIFNNAKISDHFAIIPTQETPNISKLSETEQKIYTLVAKRFMAIFYPAAVFEVTTRITRVNEHAFKTEGKVLKEPGWLAIYGREEQTSDANDENSQSLPPVINGEKVDTESLEIKEDLTRPPARFSEATLLSAMEGAGKFVEDEELREAMSEKGLGTPATRAAIIEGLITEKYIERNGRELKPTVKAFDLLETLDTLKIDALSSPELTGGWEYKLKQIEQKKMTRPEFMQEIEGMTRDTIGRIRRSGDPAEVVLHGTSLVDPFSGKKMIKTLKNFRTEDNSFAIPKIIAGRVMDETEVKELLEKRVVGPLDDFRNRMGRSFSAYVRLADNKEVTLDWGANDDDAEAPDFSGQEPLGICPVTGRRVFETPNAYITEPAEGKTKSEKEAFRMSRKILEQDIGREQVVKLLKDRKTDLFTGFVSKRTRRPFKAYLVLKDDGKTSFEFPPREAKPKKGATKKTAKKKTDAEEAAAE
ncbi:MAG: DNA topoisomerase III [Verrucomicrobiales bacterium]|jgi:DNA topoisomerase-3|nr:DNA topoisomerase III [Verrucomicrobiales bacterium]